MKFRATVELGGKTATGIEVPEEVVTSFGKGKCVPAYRPIGMMSEDEPASAGWTVYVVGHLPGQRLAWRQGAVFRVQGRSPS